MASLLTSAEPSLSLQDPSNATYASVGVTNLASEIMPNHSSSSSSSKRKKPREASQNIPWDTQVYAESSNYASSAEAGSFAHYPAHNPVTFEGYGMPSARVQSASDDGFASFPSHTFAPDQQPAFGQDLVPLPQTESSMLEPSDAPSYGL
ncbi:hypothetical protein GQ53DRAFT_768805 [Thozetella sp. PMI_491]|nr:hypothetical protein GQ53DRAFT_768805 [Thozetella sp. PMI_491]